MPILVCGINHKTAPLPLREKFIFAPEKLAIYLHDLSVNENIKEAVILSTCNRSEVYCEVTDDELLKNWFCRQHGIDLYEIRDAFYVHKGQAAVEHMMSVAAGLDSMVVGESQILGQMKEAYSESCAAGCVGTLFNRLFQQIFALAKEVRNSSALGACPMSVSSATVNFIKQNFSYPLQDATWLLIGAGMTIDLVLRHLKSERPDRLFIMNRSQEGSEKLAKNYQGISIPFAELANTLKAVDIVVTATGSTLPILTKKMLLGRSKPLFIVDIAVPRDVEHSVAELPAVQLYCIDDLKFIMDQNRMKSEHAAEKAREMIKQKSQEFMTWLNSFDVVASTIRAYRQQIETLCEFELTKSLRRLENGEDPHTVLIAFSRAFTNKLLHTPSVQLRAAGIAGRFDILKLARELLAIPSPESELI